MAGIEALPEDHRSLAALHILVVRLRCRTEVVLAVPDREESPWGCYQVVQGRQGRRTALDQARLAEAI